MNAVHRVAFALRKRAQVHERAGRSNYPGHVESAEEMAQAVVRDEFIAMARIIEDGLGLAVARPAEDEEYASLKEEQDK